MAELQTFNEVLEAHGYAPEDYCVELIIFNEVNQVIIIVEWPNRRFLRVPVEDNVTDWPFDKLAHAVIEALEEAYGQDGVDPPKYMTDL